MIVADDDETLDTWIVPTLGGQPRLFLTNASALTWIRERNAVTARGPSVLFSEFTRRGSQLSIVSSTESRSGQRTVYMPPETGMAHHSYLSPDGTHVLLAEMTANTWLPCRLMPFDGSSLGKPVGPAPAQCTDAAWSPDGNWMYFSTNAGNGTHIWRQRFPDGTPEQVTFGVTEEEGIHFDPDGRSFVTSIGSRQSTVWIHDARGDRQITSEGYAFSPTVSPDSKNLYYLARDGGTRTFLTGDLWVADLESGQRRRLLPDFQVRHYTISADGRRVVFVALDEAGRTPVWLAPLDGRSPPRRLTTIDGFAAYFGAPGEVVFDAEENGAIFTHRIKDDGSELQKLLATPNLTVFAVSPDGRWVSAETPTQFGATMVYPARGGAPTLICRGCNPPQGTNIVPARLSWTPDGRFLYLDSCRRHVCDSSAARPDVAFHTDRRVSVKGSCRRLAGSAPALARECISGAQSIDLCVYESVHAPQHLPGSRTVIVSRCRAIVAYVAAAVVSLQGTQPRTMPITFTDVTARAGITFVHHNGAAGQKFYPELFGGGVAVLDIDGDTWPDLLFVNGKDWPPAATRQRARPARPLSE